MKSWTPEAIIDGVTELQSYGTLKADRKPGGTVTVSYRNVTQLIGILASLLLLCHVLSSLASRSAAPAEQPDSQEVRNLRSKLAEESAELSELKNKLVQSQQPKVDGYRKHLDQACGGRPLNTSLGMLVDAETGCRAIRKKGEVDEELSLYQPISASSSQELAKNLLDGTDSEWWTPEDQAELTIDLGREVHVREFKIKWWGGSWADNIGVSVSTDREAWTTVRTDKDVVEGPTFNGYSRFPGWITDTRYIRLNLAHGHEDIWGKHERLGMRRIEVHGVSAWEPCSAAGAPCRCFGAARIWQPSERSWKQKASIGEIDCKAGTFGLPPSAQVGECQCWPAASDSEALGICREECDRLGGPCEGFEYSFVTNARRSSLGAECCFRSDIATSLVPSDTSDCHKKLDGA